MLSRIHFIPAAILLLILPTHVFSQTGTLQESISVESTVLEQEVQYRENSILDIISNGDAEVLGSVDYYIDCGDDDFLIKGNLALYDTMVNREISAEFRLRDGAHTWDYWRTALPDVLKFVSRRFHR